MICHRMTRGVYFFENVFSPTTHMFLENYTSDGIKYKLDGRMGSLDTQTFNESPDPTLFPLFLDARDRMVQHMFYDSPEFMEMFTFDIRIMDWINCLAKAPNAFDETEPQYHVDNDGVNLSIVYYPHTKWDDSWGGKLAMGSSLKISPVPNGAVMFMSHIPHKIESITTKAQSWRKTIFVRTKLHCDITKLGDFMSDVVKETMDTKYIKPKKVTLPQGQSVLNFE